MGAFLPNTTVPDNYPQSPQLGGLSTPYERGQLLIANNPVTLTVFRGSSRAGITEDEYSYVTPSLVPLVRGESEFIYGVLLKNAIPGSAAQVSGYLIEPGVAGLGAGSAFTQSVAAGGSVTPGVSSVQIQRNGVLIGTEPILDYVDTGGQSPADDAANTRVLVPSPGAVLICDSLLVGAQASFDTNTILGGNIPQTFRHLRFEIYGRADTGATDTAPLYLRFNNDSASLVYAHQLIQASAATVFSSESLPTNASAMQIGNFPASTAAAGEAGSAVVDIHNYTGTTFNKTARSISNFRRQTTTGNMFVQDFAGYWGNTAAITRIQVVLGSGNFIAGSRFTLYGLL